LHGRHVEAVSRLDEVSLYLDEPVAIPGGFHAGVGPARSVAFLCALDALGDGTTISDTQQAHEQIRFVPLQFADLAERTIIDAKPKGYSAGPKG